jgi:hypothetical protein
MARPQIANGGIWRVAENILIKQFRTADKGCPPAWWLGEVLTTLHRKNASCHEMFTQDRDKWWALVSAVMNLRVFIKCELFLD